MSTKDDEEEEFPPLWRKCNRWPALGGPAKPATAARASLSLGFRREW